MTFAYPKAFMGEIDQNQFQSSNTNNKYIVLQEKKTVPNGEAKTKRSFSTDTNDERVA